MGRHERQACTKILGVIRKMWKKFLSPWCVFALGTLTFLLFFEIEFNNESHGFGPLMANAEPYIPQTDSVVLERLPSSGNPQIRNISPLRHKLSVEPNNLKLALELAQKYIQLGQAEADPRYDGYAQAILQPWWNVTHPPPEVLILRATLRQRRHDFDAALEDLKQAIGIQPHNAQAWLTQAVIYQVRGNYDEARRSCLPLFRLTNTLVATTCIASISSLNGKAQQSFDQLQEILQQPTSYGDQELVWAWTVLGETAARLGKPSVAEQIFQKAISLGVRDNYLLCAYSDFLLDQNQPADVQDLLQNETRSDSLLLRLALAEKRLNGPNLKHHVKDLKARFGENRLRQDNRHLRNEARFALEVLNHFEQALELAQKNWANQREPWDARILLKAALHTQNLSSAQSVLDWMESVHLEDIQLKRLRDQLS